jgi:dTDP-4-dehydrorhamnose 3,5-epimerase
LKILSVSPLAIPEVLLVRYARFQDARGFFAENYRAGDFDAAPGLEPLRGARFVQENESFSRKGVARGFHFQWDPPQGKLVRTVRGRMIDVALDIRKGSPTFGKAVARDMPRREGDAEGEWIWLPPGFAHGVLFLEDTTIEYLCTAPWNPAGEAGISPLTEGVDWSLCEPAAARVARAFLAGGPVMSDKDKEGFTLERWAADPRSAAFR